MKSFGDWYYDEKTKSLKKFNKNSENSEVEVFSGSYEKAMEFFGLKNLENKKLDIEKVKSRLLNIIYFHQTNERTLTKLSTELFSILENFLSGDKCWVNESKRFEIILEALKESKEIGLNYDAKILESCLKSSSKSQNDRIYRHNSKLKEIKQLLGDEIDIFKSIFE